MNYVVIMEANRRIRATNAQAKLEIGKYGGVGVFTIDEAEIRRCRNVFVVNVSCISVKTGEFAYLIRRNLAQVLQHSVGRIALVLKHLPSIIGLTERSLVNRKYCPAQWVKQMLLYAAAQMRPNLQVRIPRWQTHGSLNCKPCFSIAFARLGGDAVEQAHVK